MNQDTARRLIGKTRRYTSWAVINDHDVTYFDEVEVELESNNEEKAREFATVTGGELAQITLDETIVKIEIGNL